MKKIYTKSVFEYNPKTDQYEVNENESHYHYVSDDAPMSHMKGHGGGGDPQVIESKNPWGPQQPYLTEGYGAAEDAFLKNRLIPNPSQDTIDAYTAMETRARAGSPLITKGSDYLQRELQGDYLYGGEGFNKAYEAARNTIIPDVESRFAKYGRTGSGLARVAETGKLSDAFANQYEKERALQEDALRFAPTYAEQPYTDAAKLAAAGQLREQIGNQDVLNKRAAAQAFLSAIGQSQGAQLTKPGSNMPSWLRTFLASTGGFGTGAFAGGMYGGIPGALIGGTIGGIGAGIDSYYQ